MNKRVGKFLDKVKTPKYQENYLHNVAPKIEKRLGTVGRRWNKWHDPEKLNGTICPYCAVGADCSGELLDSLKGIEKVSTTKVGNVIEGAADKLVITMLQRYHKKITKS